MSFWFGVSITLNVCQAVIFWVVIIAYVEELKQKKEREKNK